MRPWFQQFIAVGVVLGTVASAWSHIPAEHRFDPLLRSNLFVVPPSGGPTNRLQTFTWDARGRLFKVSDRLIQRSNTVALATNGVDFTATYDPLGRLLRTVEIVLTNSLALSNQPIVIDRTYDPAVEFLEVAVTENGRTTWKLIGPDMDGVYGGRNGTGGFDAFIPGPELFCPILGDAFGNLHAVYDQTHGSLTWYKSRLTGYGAVPGYRPVTLGTASADLGAKYAWRNRAQTSIGYVWMGATWLKPDLGETLSFDPYGYASSDTGHTPFRGNPWALWDADGRVGVNTYLTYSGYRSDDWRDSWQAILSDEMTGRGPRGDDPMVSAGPSFGQFMGGVGMVMVGFVPWVADAQDAYTVAAPGSSRLDRTLSGASLTVNAWTGGLLPNYGPIRRGLGRIGEAFSGAGHTPHVETPQVPHGSGGPPSGGSGAPDWTPTPGKVGDFTRTSTPWDRQVWQRSDIDWTLKRPDGLTNLEAAQQGLSPMRKTADGGFEGAQLHHLNQDPSGSLAEVWASTHRQINHNVPAPSWRVTDPAAAAAFRREVPAYWRWRAVQISGN